MISETQAMDYCREDISLIENYDKAVADTTRIWHCHHRLETLWWWNTSRKDLIAQGLYYKRPASELIFLTPSEHISLHTSNMSSETKKKLSEANRGRHMSEEFRRKNSEAQKGKRLSERTKKKISATLSKAIIMLNKSGEKLSTFQSSSEAEKKTSICSSHISECCNGKRLSAGGYIWRYEK